MDLKVILFSLVLFLLSCGKKNSEFDSQLWISDTISFNERERMIKDILEKGYFHFWDFNEMIDLMGRPTGNFLHEDLIHVTYQFEQTLQDEKVVHYTYLDLTFSEDSVLQHYEIIEWDTLTRFKRLDRQIIEEREE